MMLYADSLSQISLNTQLEAIPNLNNQSIKNLRQRNIVNEQLMMRYQSWNQFKSTIKHRPLPEKYKLYKRNLSKISDPQRSLSSNNEATDPVIFEEEVDYFKPFEGQNAEAQAQASTNQSNFYESDEENKLSTHANNVTPDLLAAVASKQFIQQDKNMDWQFFSFERPANKTPTS